MHTYAPESIVQIHTLLRLYPEVAETLLDAIKEHRINSACTLSAGAGEEGKPCGCIIGHTIYHLYGPGILRRWTDEPETLRFQIVEEAGLPRGDETFLRMEYDLMWDQNEAGDCPALQKILQDWIDEEAERQGVERHARGLETSP